jgi:hypothetical protein
MLSGFKAASFTLAWPPAIASLRPVLPHRRIVLTTMLGTGGGTPSFPFLGAEIQRWATGESRCMAKQLEPGTLAYREYELFVPNEPDATVAITLGDLEQDSPAARFARKTRATH